MKLVTEDGSRRIAGFAADLARRRHAEGHPGRVTIGAKHNLLRSDALFVDCCSEVLAGHGIDFEVNHIDNLARRMVAEAPDLDVVLVPNLYGDILSDLAAGVIGGLGMMPSGCYGNTDAVVAAPEITRIGRRRNPVLCPSHRGIRNGWGTERRIGVVGLLSRTSRVRCRAAT